MSEEKECTKLLKEVRRIYLYEIDSETEEPKAGMMEIIEIWDKVNKYLEAENGKD